VRDKNANAKGIMSGSTLISEVIATYLEVAAADLAGLAALYRAEEAIFPPAPLIRSVLEYCAHAMWVIGDESDPAEDCLARAYLEEFASCEAAKLAAAKLGPKTDSAYKAAQLRWSTVQKRALSSFPGATKDDLASPNRLLGGQKLLGPDSGVTWMFNLLAAKGGGSFSERQAVGIYALLSNGTHASTQPARQSRSGSLLVVDLAILETQLGVAVVVFYEALSYAVSFFGLDDSVVEDLAAEIDSVMPQVWR
jgi:hypothetical protein